MATEDDAAPREILYIIASGNAVQFGTRLLMSALVPFVLTDFNTTKSEVGLALTGMWAVYAMSQFPSCVLADHYGERQLLLVSLGGTALGVVLVAVAPTLASFALLLLVIGAGAGLFYPPASVLVTRFYDAHGSALGTLTAFGAFAGLVYPAVGGFASGYVGWRPVLGFSAVFTGLIVVVTVRVLPRIPPVNEGRPLTASIDVWKYMQLLRRPGIVYTIVIAIVLIFSFQGLISFYPVFLVEYHEIDRGLAGAILGGVLGVSMFAQRLNGRFSDAVSRDAALAVSISLIGISLAVLLAVQGLAGAVIGSVVLGVGISYPGPLQARFMDLLGESERGYGFGLVRTVYMFLGASGSLAIGLVSDASGWVIAYAVLGALLAGCLVLLGLNKALSLDL
jgi:predicted MFS family arabinose efflux permease